MDEMGWNWASMKSGWTGMKHTKQKEVVSFVRHQKGRDVSKNTTGMVLRHLWTTGVVYFRRLIQLTPDFSQRLFVFSAGSSAAAW